MTSNVPSLHQSYLTSLVLYCCQTSFRDLTALTLLSLVRHFSPQLRRNLKDIPSCRNISTCNVPRSSTPGKLLFSCLLSRITMMPSTLLNALAFPFSRVSELNPFNQLAYGPLSSCLRLKAECYHLPSKTRYE